MSKQELEANIAVAKAALENAEKALADFKALAENNVYPDLDHALGSVEDDLLQMAHRDCEGSYNCGADSYTQEFIAAGIRYVGTLTCEYNRHDKTYYYVDGSKFSYKEAA